MYKGRTVAVLVPAHNEEGKIGSVVKRCDLPFVDALLVINDGSTDQTAQVAEDGGATVLTLDRVSGVGSALRAGMEWAREGGYDLAVFLAGNNKDDPSQIPRLLDPICDEDHDLVVGSRFLEGGAYGGDMPTYRKFATRLHPWLLSVFLGKKLTESTNGFRAFKLSILDDPRINLHQRWLDAYGLEVYLLWRTIKLGYRHTEVACTKIYPPKSLGYTKMKPITGWWSILRPIFLLGLGIKT